jgi:uncharacterized membrane protein
MADETNSELPAHVEQTVQRIAALHEQHAQRTTPAQRFLAATTRLVGSPAFAGVFSALLVLWVGANLYQLSHANTPLDAPPFGWVQVTTGVLGFYVTILILITQRHENRLEESRAQLTLQLGMLAERQNAKIIEMLEQLRHDHPQIADRVDDDAIAMSRPASPEAVLEAINSRQPPP